MTRNGKIARLPFHIRDELNHRLYDGEQGLRLVEWLNSLPDVKRVLERDFSGHPVNEQNLSDWKAGGYEEWRTQEQEQSRICEQTLAAVYAVGEFAAELDHASDELTHSLAAVMAGHYAVLLQNWNGEMTDQFRAKVRALRALTRDIVRLRRSHQCSEGLELQRKKMERHS